MISTIPSAEDLFAGEKKKYLHKDELWLWIPATEEGIEHLKGFLNAFSTEPVVVSCQKEMEVEFFGENAKELEAVFQESFLPIPNTQTQLKEKTISLAVLRFPAGRINSRKEMVTPFLPRLVI